MSQASEIKDFHNIKFLKYPVHRIEYTYKTGSIAEKLVSDILREEGIDIEYHDVHENGVDVKAKDIDIGIEVWNWSKPHEYSSRIQSVLENLKPFQFRALVTSFISKDVKDYIESTYIMSPIFIIELGFQILPKEWKDFYKNRKNIVFYPSREAYVKVKLKLKPLIDAIKRVRRDKILDKYFPSYDYGDMVILDATGCTNEQFNNFLRDLEQQREKVALITVQEPSIESPFNNLLSTKEPFYAYVYENNLNLKNENLKIRVENIEAENNKARTEEETKSSTFKEISSQSKEISGSEPEFSPSKGKISTVSVKIRSFYNRLKISVLNLLSNLWFDKTGNVALIKKPRTFTWKPKYGFQVAPNQFQMRLMKQTYPCEYKFLVWCTEYKKFRYLCKLSSSFDCVFDTSIRLYKNRWYCYCNEDGEEYCPSYDTMCYYNMDREQWCRWHKPRMIEQELMAKAIEWKKPKSSGKKMVKVSRM
jgi:hypothetical protein